MLIIELLYLLSTAILALYGLHALFNALAYWWLSRSNPEGTVADPARLDSDGLPTVTVQLPVYNERHVVERLLHATAALDWPRDRLQIQVLDDSNDDTTHIIAETVAIFQDQGVWIEHVRRPDRSGYKAGGLQVGLQTAAGELVAIFDADFVPQPDFLHQTIPAFSSEEVGCVQTRWGHINRETSRLTMAQALGIDGHFTVEQLVRHRMGAFLNFNGTAGVWRRRCMGDAGGWQGDTLTEDLDLSYRAQLKGWRIVYLPEVEVPAELPVQIDAFKRQQFRWAKGSLQTALKLSGTMWQSRQPLWRKVLGSLHITGYLAHLMMLLNLLLILPVTYINSSVLMLTPIFSLATIGPPLLYWLTMRTRNPGPLRKQLLNLGLLILLGTGLAVNNSKAAFEAFSGRSSAFKRTPKFAGGSQARNWQQSNYTLPRDPTSWIELFLAIYAIGLLIYGVTTGRWWMLLWISMYASGFLYMAYLSFAQAFQLNRRRVPALHVHPADLQG